ncbi:helix-turn-helix domain-containing protein [Chryseobacterium kwangjuense]|uniref:Helix-turn-helix domain-containing protein n=1 Tax=Chryseobacterium kwangjuense TaxID=267125 RepID=A0ABW9K717_9FLAO
MEKKITFFLLLIISNFICSQQFDFESQYKYARSLSSKNPDSSEIVLNTIIDSAQKKKQPKYLAKAYYLKSFNSYLKSDAKGTLDFAEKALKISSDHNYGTGKALAYRMQGTQYAKLGLLKEASQSLNNGLSEIKNENTDEAHELKGMIYNSFLILFNHEEYRKKELYSKNAVREFQQIRNIARRNELLVSAYTNLGYTFAELGKFDESQSFLTQALALVGNDNYYLKSSILHDIGFSFSQQKKPDSAVVYYQKSLELASRYGFNEKKIEITRNLEEAYHQLGDVQNVQKYKLKNLELKDSIAYNQKMAVNKTLNQKEENFDRQLTKSRSISKGLVVACTVLLLVLGGIGFYIIYLRKKHKKAVARIYQQGITPVAYEEDPQETEDQQETAATPDIKISPETEEHILNGLKTFEESLDFNHKNISRYHLSNAFNVNTKYLSAVIKKHKKFNFNQYINHLRINYVVDKLKNDPQYRKYKINHLAEITGYSSHSAFSLEFKKITGIHPSAFIKALEEIS